MKNNPLNIKLGKSYSANFILEKMEENLNVNIMFGHILVEYETEKKHKYFIDKDFIKNLKVTPMKVYTIITRPNCQNFAYRLLEEPEVKGILEKIDENNNIHCIIDENDLRKANYNHIGMKKAISLINKVFKANKMTIRASTHNEEIKVKYSKIKEKECMRN